MLNFLRRRNERRAARQQQIIVNSSKGASDIFYKKTSYQSSSPISTSTTSTIPPTDLASKRSSAQAAAEGAKEVAKSASAEARAAALRAKRNHVGLGALGGGAGENGGDISQSSSESDAIFGIATRTPTTKKGGDGRRRRVIVRGKENQGGFVVGKSKNSRFKTKNKKTDENASLSSASSGKEKRRKEEKAREERRREQKKREEKRKHDRRKEEKLITSKWARRFQQRAAAKAAAVQARKAKKNRGVKHEPRVLRQSITTDRRKSIKVVKPIAPTPSNNQPAQVGATDGGALVPGKLSHHKGDLPSSKTKANSASKMHSATSKISSLATSAGSQSRLPTSSATRKPGVASQRIWPHFDLAVALQRNDMKAADVALRRIAAVAGKDDGTRDKMVSEGASKLLIEVLKSENATLDMRRNATLSIAELAVLDKNEHKLVAAGVVPVLIWLLNPRNGSDRNILASSARGLRNLLGGAESTAVQAARYGCVEPLLGIINGRSGHASCPDIIVEVVAAVANLAHHGSRFQSYIIKHGGLEALNILGQSTTNEEAMFHVVNVFAEFARENRWHRPIIATGGLKSAFRALTMSQDIEVVAEAARIVGNVSITSKARASVRDSGGVAILSKRMTCCSQFTELVPAFDLVRALSNVCLDPRAATDALSPSLSTVHTLLRAYTTPNVPNQIVNTAGRCLAILAQRSATRRAKVLHAIGAQVNQAGLAGKPTKSLYDLRGKIIKEAEGEEVNAPNTLERLSRNSMRLMYSGAVGNFAADMPGKSTKQKDRQTEKENPQAPDVKGTELKKHVDAIQRKGTKDRSNFKSTGRILSVTRKEKRISPVIQGQNLQEGQQPEQGPPQKQKQEEEEEEEMPRASEEALPSTEELRKRQISAVIDEGMTKELFEIGQVLGKGGYGTVMLAKNLVTQELVAIKRFHQSGSMVDKKAIKEQRIWRGLHHKNVVEYKGSFVGDNGTLCLVVEYVDGLSLAEHLSQYPAFPETLVAEISRQVLNGLEYLHANGVTHRDLKPANILVTNSAVVKICDFGVSASENVQTINPGQHMVGTPWYIAPEMVEYRPWTHSLDIWSLGCTVLELATGRRPYHELSAMQVLFRMVEDRRPPIPETLSQECQDFLKSCWMWDPEERPSAAALKSHPFILKAKQLQGDTKSP